MLWMLLFAVLPVSAGSGWFKVMFYNTENFFDTDNDPLTLDDDFTADGYYCWTQERYDKKLDDVVAVIDSVGNGAQPALIGLCEVENAVVLNDLTARLENDYDYLHQDSPDERGIDVALLYRKSMFRLLSGNFFSVKADSLPKLKTRDILYAKGIVPTGDTLHVFVNHWPSHRDGKVISEPRRLLAAAVLKQKIDSIYRFSSVPNIIIMGDLNDTPSDKSVAQVLGAEKVTDNAANNILYNLLYNEHETTETGTMKYGSKWLVFDHIIVSGALLNINNDFYTSLDYSGIFSARFLKVFDRSKTGSSPFRTYKKNIYKGGISDHFPVYVNFFMKRNMF